ncbi:MAG TPA: hypothetical protein ENG29_02755 [Firmicutes bacterium]|uniref:Roadblock/LAMTOR2 domain-containing protein n=1 Tax=Candidatus Coatesbacteria bacterium 4484_99 TaxID=1970774 RepID=A0A1W9S1G2_9BACT|nr:MAG: hypothetical protein B6D57_02440 [Candidatus Coatesbacteria bacterium 4484_99]RLC39314.1 MAG: hypothetical protein DRH51_07350 [Candidatus Coatesbacteria bacterium]HDM43288.1 hypothetical protein [Bacillota bacterium]RLC43887.1 MAG: hypothetical protein DRH49_00120 [Candidatus Coatesbacteria bacterium]RLC44301.1 MAG: hypothetical protein DRH44_02795 [Candidatus Coatesbacteria bacterium]
MVLNEILVKLVEEGPLKKVILVDYDGFLIEKVGVEDKEDDLVAAIVRDLLEKIKKITRSSSNSLPIQGIFETTSGLVAFSFFPNNLALFGVSKDGVKIRDVWNSLSKMYKTIAEAL